MSYNTRLQTANADIYSLIATANALPNGLPSCTTDDHGDTLRVVNGTPAWTDVEYLQNTYIDVLSDLTQLVQDCAENMDNHTVRRLSIKCDFELFGAAVLTIYKGSDVDSGIEVHATLATAQTRLYLYGYADGEGADFSFHDWRWENPPMYDGLEYCTTEQWDGKPVYTMRYECGTLPNSTSKEYSLPISSQISPVLIEGYAYNDESEWPFPVYANGNIAAYLGYKNDSLYVKTAINLTNFNFRVVIKYTK